MADITWGVDTGKTPSWITVTPSGGTGDSSISVSATPATGSSDVLNGTIVITGSNGSSVSIAVERCIKRCICYSASTATGRASSYSATSATITWSYRERGEDGEFGEVQTASTNNISFQANTSTAEVSRSDVYTWTSHSQCNGDACGDDIKIPWTVTVPGRDIQKCTCDYHLEASDTLYNVSCDGETIHVTYSKIYDTDNDCDPDNQCEDVSGLETTFSFGCNSGQTITNKTKTKTIGGKALTIRYSQEGGCDCGQQCDCTPSYTQTSVHNNVPASGASFVVTWSKTYPNCSNSTCVDGVVTGNCSVPCNSGPARTYNGTYEYDGDELSWSASQLSGDASTCGELCECYSGISVTPVTADSYSSTTETINWTYTKRNEDGSTQTGSSSTTVTYEANDTTSQVVRTGSTEWTNHMLCDGNDCGGVASINWKVTLPAKRIEPDKTQQIWVSFVSTGETAECVTRITKSTQSEYVTSSTYQLIIYGGIPDGSTIYLTCTLRDTGCTRDNARVQIDSTAGSVDYGVSEVVGWERDPFAGNAFVQNGPSRANIICNNGTTVYVDISYVYP